MGNELLLETGGTDFLLQENGDPLQIEYRFEGRLFDIQFWNLELSSTDAANLADGKQISKNGAVTTPAFSNYSVVAT